MRYLVTETRGITVEAESADAAEEIALAMLDGGFGEVVAVEVEPITRKGEEG